MKNKILFQQLQLALMSFACLMILSCGQSGGFSTVNSSLGNGQGDDSSQSDSAVNPNSWEKVELDIAGRMTETDALNSENAGHLAIYVERAQQSIVLVSPIPSIALGLQVGGKFPELEHPEYPGLKLISYRVPDGQSYVSLRIPFKYMIKNGQLIEEQTLPNGDSLPVFLDGESPIFAVQFPPQNGLNYYAYFGAGSAALYLETKKDIWPVPFKKTYRIRNKVKQVVGAIAMLPKTSRSDNGVFLAARLPNGLSRVIDDLIRQAPVNP